LFKPGLRMVALGRWWYCWRRVRFTIILGADCAHIDRISSTFDA